MTDQDKIQAWLEQNRATTERPDRVELAVVDGLAFHFRRDDTTSAEYRCEKSGVYGYRDPLGRLPLLRGEMSRVRHASAPRQNVV